MNNLPRVAPARQTPTPDVNMSATVAHLPRGTELPKDFESILHNLSPITTSCASASDSRPHLAPLASPDATQIASSTFHPSEGLLQSRTGPLEGAAGSNLALISASTHGHTPNSGYTIASPRFHALDAKLPAYGSIIQEIDPEHRFSDGVMAEALRFLTEQEKTRQVHHKVELGQMVLQLMREASTLGFAEDLIRRLFVDGDLVDLDRNLAHKFGNYTTHTPPEKPGDEAGSKKRRIDKLPPPRQQPLPISHLQPLQLLHHLPVHRLPPPAMAKVSLPPSMTHKPVLPPMAMHPQLYPVYYALVPEKASFEMPSKQEEGSSLGLPYMGRNYSSVMYPAKPPYMPQHSLHRMQQPAYYYVNSAQQVPVASQFIVPAPSGKMVAWPVGQAEPVKEEEPPKRKRLAKNINFMITTPKNPPAKKYNK